MPSYGGAHGPDGSKKTGDQGQGTRDKDGGNSGGGGGWGGGKDLSDQDVNDLMTGHGWPSSTGPGGVRIDRTGTIKGRTRGVDDLTALQKALAKFKGRGWGWDVLDAVAGPLIDVDEPDFMQPGSFLNGDWHTSTDVPGVIGGMLGMGLGAPPFVSGWIGSEIGDLFGIDPLYHGGWGRTTAAGGTRRGGGGTGGSGEKTNNSTGGGGIGGGIAGGGSHTPTPVVNNPPPKPVTPPTQGQTPPTNVSYYLPIKNRDTGEIEYIFDGTKMNNPNFGLAQGWGANIVFL